MQKLITDTEKVDRFMEKLQHPLKAEVQALRELILEAAPELNERIKWNAPSFYFEKDMAAFHLRPLEYVHLIFIFHHGHMIESKGLLEGNYKDRRMAKFYSMEDVQSKKKALTKVVKQWVKQMRTNSSI